MGDQQVGHGPIRQPKKINFKNDNEKSHYFAELDVSECPSIRRSNDGLAGLDSVSEVTESVAVVVGKASSGEPHPEKHKVEERVC